MLKDLREYRSWLVSASTTSCISYASRICRVRTFVGGMPCVAKPYYDLCVVLFYLRFLECAGFNYVESNAECCLMSSNDFKMSYCFGFIRPLICGWVTSTASSNSSLMWVVFRVIIKGEMTWRPLSSYPSLMSLRGVNEELFEKASPLDYRHLFRNAQICSCGLWFKSYRFRQRLRAWLSVILPVGDGRSKKSSVS